VNSTGQGLCGCLFHIVRSGVYHADQFLSGPNCDFAAFSPHSPGQGRGCGPVFHILESVSGMGRPSGPRQTRRNGSSLNLVGLNPDGNGKEEAWL
jgi:hypothetical protein